MKDDIPLVYWTFRSVWTVVHVFIVAVLTVLLLWWALTNGNAERIFQARWEDLLYMQRVIANAIPFPWS